MQHFIVIGNPINHSKSPEIHHAFGKQTGLDICYTRQFCPDHADSFVAVVQAFFNGGGVGANVTLPFKQIAYQLCYDTGALSDNAKLAGAVNTLAWRDGKPFGDNTDGKGLVRDISDNLAKDGLGNLMDKSALILGAGGATYGVILPLLQAGVAHITIANRTYDKAVQLVAHFDTHQHKPNQLTATSLDKLDNLNVDIIINATSATTTNQALNLPPSLTAKFAYDMMYGKPSAFLEHFKAQGASICDGLGMLLAQASFSFELWTGVKAETLDLKSIRDTLK